MPGNTSNAIGSFEIGVSPIGTQPDFNWFSTIISQYANSPVLLQLIQNINDCLDQTANFDAFFDLIWNVDTAQGYGLDVWGRIVGVTRILQVSNQDYLGFEEAVDVSLQSFGQAPLYSGVPLTNSYTLTDDAFRVLIFAKALSNITDGSIKAINQLLLNLFPGRGNCYVRDGGEFGDYFGFEESGTGAPFGQQSFVSIPVYIPAFGFEESSSASGFGQLSFNTGDQVNNTIMTMTYVFKFLPTPVELAIIEESGVLPKPTGVQAFVSIE